MRRKHKNGGAAVDYVVPFLILICIGVIIILAFNLWRALIAPVVKEAAYMHMVNGSVQLKVWGTDHYFDLDSDTLIMQGDTLKTAGGSHVIVEFFDGTIMRVDGGSELVFTSIDDETKVPEIMVSLERGSLWFNRIYNGTSDTDITVDMDDIVVHAELSSVFMLDFDEYRSVAVASVFDNGEGVLVDVMSEDKSNVVESEKVGVAQQILFTSDVLAKYREFQSPTVLGGISDDFKSSKWYVWNLAEDRSPTVINRKIGGTENVGLIPVESEVILPDSVDVEVDDHLEPEIDVDEEVEVLEEVKSIEEEEVLVDLGELTAPSVTSVSGVTELNENGFYFVNSNPATLVGSISGAAKVVVNGYTLSKFKPGDSKWTYYANADYGLLSEGENFYEVYALDANGIKSEVVTVPVLFSPHVEEVSSMEVVPVLEENSG